MGLQDLPYVAQTHLDHFPDGFFARLGPRFLARYYRTFLDGPTAVAVIAESDGAPTGYLTGVLRTGQHRQLLLRHHGPALALAGLVAMVRRPQAAWIFLATRLPRYLRGLRRDLTARGGTGAPVPEATPSSPARATAVLSHVVVNEPGRHCGLGTHLVRHFLNEATGAGCAGAALVTIADTGAGPFYERLGWTRTGTSSTAEGTRLWRYAIALPAADRPAASEDHT